MRIRKLFVEVTTKWLGEAKLKASKAAGDAAAATFRELSQVADTLADRSERAAVKLTEMARAAREAAAAGVRISRVMADVPGSSAANVRPASPRAAPRRQGPDPIDAAIRRSNTAVAASEGLTAGRQAITAATDALGKFASAEDKAKAKTADLNAQIDRNRREMAALRAEAVRTGDANGTLAARMKGLSAATGEAQGKLVAARRELREIDGGFLGAIKSGTGLAGGFAGLTAAAGTFVATGIINLIQGIGAGLASAASQAIEFEKAFVNISKVTRGADDTEAGLQRIEDGIKRTSKELGVMPDQVTDLTAALAPVFSGKLEDGAAVDLVGLTNDVTKIGAAWDVSGQQAGKFFADTSRGLGTTTAETKLLFGSINELGNQIGVKSADIAEAVTRSAGVIKASGLSGETGAALNATLIAAGASSEVAATGVRTFIARLEAGSAATPKQAKAFEALGFSAVDVGKKMSKGGKEAEDQILAIVTALRDMPKENQLPTLIELFGSESIGSIGAAATAVDTLGTAFKIATDKGRAAVSVQEEYDKVSNTAAAKIDKLKASIAVMAIEIGDALLPHIDKVVAFLNSEAGQEWGRQAVEKVTAAINTLVEGFTKAWDIMSKVQEMMGKVEILTGPLTTGFAGINGALDVMSTFMTSVVNTATALGEAFEALKEGRVIDAIVGVGKALIDGILEPLRSIVRQVIILADAIPGINVVPDALREFAGVMPKAGAIHSGDDYAAPTPSATTAEIPDVVAPMGPARPTATSDPNTRFDELVALAEQRQLKPSESKELKRLSKTTDRAIPKKPGRKKGDGWNEEQRRIAAEARMVKGDLGEFIDTDKLATKTAQRLGNAGGFKENFHLQAIANSNPELAKVLNQGRTKNEKGKLGKPQNELDKLLEDRILNGPTAHGVSGSRGSDAVAPPAISNTINYNMSPQINLGGITVEPAGDTSIQNIRGAAVAATDTVVTGWKEAAIIFNGR